MKKKINTALPALSRMGVLLLIIVMGAVLMIYVRRMELSNK